MKQIVEDFDEMKDPGGTKREKFIKLAEARTDKINDMIRKLGNLSNEYFYEYTDKDINRIFYTIEKELNSAHSKFMKEKETEDGKFKIIE